jgi:hypothetical protein
LQRQINQWIFGNLLEGISLHAESPELIFAANKGRPEKTEEGADGNGTKPNKPEEDDGLIVSETPVKVIELPMHQDQPEPDISQRLENVIAMPEPPSPELAWLTQPLSGRTLAWTVDVLVVFASLLLFTLVFLSVTREAPPWPLASIVGAALMMAGMYWVFFRLFVGGSLGAKLARIAEADVQAGGPETRFR